MFYSRSTAIRLFFFIVLILVSIVFPCVSFGGGFETYFIGSRGKVMGGALTGVADDPSAVFYNPAGIATLKPGPVHWELSASATYINYSYHDRNDENKKYESELVPVIPSVFMSKNISNDFAFGFGMYVPWGGGGVDYKKTSATQPVRDGYLGIAAFTPAVSYKITSAFSVGMGLSAYYGSVERTIVPGPTVEEEYSGYAGYNAHFGFLIRPGSQYGIGFIVRTPTKISLDGTSEVVGMSTQDSTLDFTLPAKVSVGISYRRNDALLIASNCSYLFYDNLENMVTHYQSGQVVNSKTGFKNYFDIGIGAEYTGLDNITFRGGIRYSPSGTSNAYINAFSNDIDYILFDAGVGYQIMKDIELVCNFTYNYGIDASNQGGEYGAYQVSSLIGLRTSYRQ